MNLKFGIMKEKIFFFIVVLELFMLRKFLEKFLFMCILLFIMIFFLLSLRGIMLRKYFKVIVEDINF